MYSDPNLELDTPPPRSQFRRPWSPEPFVPYHNHESGGDEGVDEHGYGYGFTKVDHDLYGMDPSHHHHLRQQQQQQQKDNQDYSRGTSPHRQHRLQQQRQRREASDVSVEALDLADYARTLRFRQAEDPYPPFPSQLRNGNGIGIGNENSGLGSSTPVIPGLPGTRLGATSPTRIHLRPPPNSLVSGSRGTLSSNTHTHQTHSSAQSQSRGRRTSRRPFSMPVTPQASSSRGHLNSYIHDNDIADPYSHPYPHTHSNPNRGPYIIDPETDVRASSTQEIDISHFPKWSRGWYNTPNNHHQPTGDDLYDPIPPSRLNFDSTGTNRTGKSPFDPSYNINGNNNHNPYGTYDLPSSSSPPPPLSSVGHGSTRDLLPWSNDPPEYGPPLDPLQKEERMRMLEREFGAKGNAQGKGKGRDDGMLLVDEEGKPFIGTVDERGRLVTVGPKRRVAFRTIQVLLAVGACVPVLYAAVAIKPLDPKKPPPPANKPPIFVLYVLSVLTLLLLLYMFVIRPCCIVRRKPRSANPLGLPGMGMGMGMMVLPVGHNAKGKGKKKNKGGKGKKGKGMGMGEGGDVQVNLIVDPDAFRLPGEDEDDTDESEDESDDDDEYMMTGPHMPGGLPTLLHHHHQQQYQYHQHKQKQKQKRKTKKRRQRQRRRGIREGLMMEAEWKVARAWAKKLAMLDVAGVVLWGAAFVFIMLGKRCPSGEFGGWCNAYNVSTASGCLLCVAFGVSLFFDVQDLHASKQSPRTRTK